MDNPINDNTLTKISHQKVSRRSFLRGVAGGLAAGAVGLPLASCTSTRSATSRRVVVLGLDGLDPGRIRALIEAGRAPNFKKLKEMGTFRPLGTTMPAQCGQERCECIEVAVAVGVVNVESLAPDEDLGTLLRLLVTEIILPEMPRCGFDKSVCVKVVVHCSIVLTWTSQKRNLAKV